ncbi:MAG: lysylphosphatidylglycerol synthase transmembrane domain-containing protein [Paracoccaceae bacterium]
MSSTNQNTKALLTSSNQSWWREHALLLGMLLFVIFGLIGLAAVTGWEEILAQIAKLSVLQVCVLLALSLVNYLLRGLRWHIFVTRLGLGTSLFRNMVHFLAGFAMVITPGRVGELVRMRWLRRETGWPIEKTAPLLLVDRASDLAAMGAILALTLAFSTNGIAWGLPVAVMAIIGALISVQPRLLALIAGAGYGIIGRWPRFFARIRTAARSLNHFTNPLLMLTAATIGAFGWFAEGVAFHFLLVWMGADIGLSTAVAIFVFSTIAGGLTGAPGGIGGAEAAMVALLTFEGIPLEVSLPATAVIRLTTLWFAILIGMITFPFAERHSIKVQNALEKN